MDNRPSTFKKFIRSFGIVIAITFVYLSFTGYFYVAPPWKPTHPDEKGFKLTEFHLTDYSSRGELSEAIRILIPIGASTDKVDNVLVNIAGAKSELLESKLPIWKGKIRYRYSYNSPFRYFFLIFMPVAGGSWPTHKIVIEYTEELKVKDISILSVVGGRWPFSSD